jgi:hypothetical protein
MKKNIKQEYEFNNDVHLIGRVTKKDEFVNFIPFPVFGIEIEVPKPSFETVPYHFFIPEKTEPTDFSTFRVIFLKNESIITDLEIGDKIMIKGELQSRNFNQQHPMTDDLLQSLVDIYTNLHNSSPTDKEPTQFKREPIVWKKMLNLSILEEIPNDSCLDIDNKLISEPNKPYTYKVDRNGVVTKETKETIVEVVSFDYKKIEEFPETDHSSILISGRIADHPQFEIEDNNIYLELKVQTFQKSFEPDEKRFAFARIRILGLEAQEIFNSYKKNDYIHLHGTFVSELYNLSFKIKKITSGNKTKKKKIELIKSTHLILSDANSIQKQ